MPKKVAGKVTQETFNSAVKENIEDLGMGQQEAIEEAFKQFQLQGADLTQVSKKNASKGSSTNDVITLIKDIEKLSKQANDDLLNKINQLRSYCDESVSNRVAAGNEGAYGTLIKVLECNRTIVHIKVETLKTLASLQTQNPDLLNESGVDMMLTLMNKNEEPSVKKATLKWAKECCVMHELNRQSLMDKNIVAALKPLLETEALDIQRDIMSLLRALVLDDDVRVEFGRAHENARIIASETLCFLIALMNRNQNDDKFVNDLMMTITALMVRAEFCKKVETAGGLDLLKTVLISFPKNEKIVRQCFKLIKALAGNDDVKMSLIQNLKLAPILYNSLNFHKAQSATAIAGLAAIAALSLRSPENSNKLFDAGIPEVIVEIMRLFPDDKMVQKTASWAIRNMVARSKFQCSSFQALGVEEILQENLKKFKDLEYDTKAALRDLGCKVVLNEQWTGKGGALTTGKKLMS